MSGDARRPARDEPPPPADDAGPPTGASAAGSSVAAGQRPDTTIAGAVGAADAIDTNAVLAEFEAERPARTASGYALLAIQAIAVGLALFALYRTFTTIPAQLYRPLFLAVALPLTFLAYRAWTRRGRAADGAGDNPGVIDWALALISVVPLAYIAYDWQGFFRRAVRATELDIVMGTLLVLVVLEAARRTVGWVVPAIVVAFLAYAYAGPIFPAPFTTDHHDWDRLIGHNVMSTSGIFGVPLDVAATYIILFTVYGAVLEFSGASRFFLDLSFAAFGQSRAGPGRTVTLAGFLLGTVSGSGVATTVTLGGVSWPILKRAGYPKEEAGGVLAAAGIGAILSPPTLGAAAFLIAEYLDVSYLNVIIWATVPTCLYYLGIVLAIEMDARRYRTHAVSLDTPPAGRLLLRYGYHFSSLIAIVAFLALGVTPFRAVVYATALQFVLAFLDRRTWWTPRRAWEALAHGATGVLSVTAVMAAAGIIVGVLTLTGLGFSLARIIVDFAGGNLFLTALFSAISVMLLGLAVPVTASFIISWTIIGPALIQLGVPNFAAGMFIFYYAVLSEVSPPTALSPFAASAITGGRPVRTMWLTWKYTLPAFLVPFVFVLAPEGRGLLLAADPTSVALAVAVAAVGIAGLAVATGAWILGPASIVERALFGAGGLALLFIEPAFIAAGIVLMLLGLAVHLWRRRESTSPAAA